MEHFTSGLNEVVGIEWLAWGAPLEEQILEDNCDWTPDHLVEGYYVTHYAALKQKWSTNLLQIISGLQRQCALLKQLPG